MLVLASRVALFLCVLIGLAGLLLGACHALERALTRVAERYRLTDSFLRFVVARQAARRAGLPAPSVRELELARAHTEARGRIRELEQALEAIAREHIDNPAEHARWALGLFDDEPPS